MSSPPPANNQPDDPSSARQIGDAAPANSNQATMVSFDFQMRTRVVFGAGKLQALGQVASEIGARCVLLVTDPGIVAAGHAERALQSLRAAGIAAQLFDGVAENPTTDHVAAGLAVARRHPIDSIVGLGGGSSMDCAKGINFLLTGGGRIQDYWGTGKATQPMLPAVAVPTTAGTGSETQSYALISDAQTHVKMACGDKKASFRAAILDPQLTVTQPPRITALTGIDAIAHAIETSVTRVRNPASMAFSREAWLLLGENFARVLQNPGDLAARGGMQLGACFAGLAIENSMLGAAHALANPLTAQFGIVHGQAIGLMLPHVIRFNGLAVDHWYRDLLQCTESLAGFPSSASGSAGLADFVAKLVSLSGLKTRLTDFNIPHAALDALAADALTQWTGSFNPRKLAAADLRELYSQAF